MPIVSAKSIADRLNHIDLSSATTLKTVANEDADMPEGEIEMMDLCIRGSGEDAYFQWFSEYGDPIGEPLSEIEEKDIEARILSQVNRDQDRPRG